MLLFGHIGLTMGLARALSREIDARWVAATAMLPDVIDKPLLFAGDNPVQSFGIWDKGAAADQVVILDYVNPDDFIIRLQTLPKTKEMLAVEEPALHARITDEVILAKVSPNATLMETIDAVYARIVEDKFQQARDARNGEQMRLLLPRLILDGSEIVQIPKINFDLLHHFTELEGTHFKCWLCSLYNWSGYSGCQI